MTRITPTEAEAALLKAGFEMIRSTDGVRIYIKGDTRVAVPFQGGKTLHPKAARRALKSAETP